MRFDYRGNPRPARFFFGAKGSKEVAEEVRQQQAGMWRNVPLQGIYIENVEFLDLYSVYDEEEEENICYAPLELTVTAYSLDDCLRFVNRTEFRRLEILEPSLMRLSSREMERFLHKVNETIRQTVKALESR